MLQHLPNFANFQKIQLNNLADFEKCCKTRICLQRSVPIQPKTSEIAAAALSAAVPSRATAAVAAEAEAALIEAEAALIEARLKAEAEMRYR